MSCQPVYPRWVLYKSRSTDNYALPETAASYAEIQITYRQNSSSLIKHYQNGTLPPGMSFDDKNVIVRLTQDETKKFMPAVPVSVQVRVLTNGGDAYASDVFKCSIKDVLNDEVLA